jgi:hypothetical protein
MNFVGTKDADVHFSLVIVVVVVIIAAAVLLLLHLANA